MSFGAFDDAKEQVRQSVDIVEVLRNYMDLRPQGRDLVGLCPWHDDSRPSLRVNRERQYWKCWVCNVGGDVFSFIMRREGVGFREALEMLAERAGVVLPSARPAAPGSPDDKRTLYQAAAWAEEQFHRYLLQAPEAEPARRYIAERQINSESVRRYRLGFSPNSWQWLLDRAKGTPYSPQVLEALGLASRSSRSGNYFDFFRGRLIFPIRDSQSRPVAFGARHLPGITQGDGPKYINSTETRLYRKSEQFYGLDVVRHYVEKHRRISIVEGYTDVILSVQHGIEDVVAVCGTALTEQHLRLLKRYADVVTLILDGDAAGQNQSNRILEMFIAEQLDLRVLTLPDGLDPADYLARYGAESFRELAEGAVDALDYKIRNLLQGLDPSRDTHRANQALEEILRVVSLAPASNSLAAARLREQQIIARLARLFHVLEPQLHARLAELRQTRRTTSKPVAPLAEPRWTCRSLPAWDCELLAILCVAPELTGAMSEAFAPSLVESPPARQIYELFLELFRSGQTPDAQTVMSRIEDLDLQSLLVELIEQADEKAERSEQTPSERLEELKLSYQRRQQELDRRRRLTALQQNLDSQEELRVLEEMIELTRQRQGF